MALGCLWGPADEAEAWSIVLWLGLIFFSLLVSTDMYIVCKDTHTLMIWGFWWIRRARKAELDSSSSTDADCHITGSQ
jgi:hypothetical protein